MLHVRRQQNWHAEIRDIAGGHGQRFALFGSAGPLSCSDVIGLWRDSADFRTYFNALLAAAPFQAFRWETPPVTEATADQPFEFVLLDSPALVRDADRDTFAQHFCAPDAGEVVQFPNLGRDGIMVAPCPREPESAYVHLAAFVRHAPQAQQRQLWKTVGAAMNIRLGPIPVWLSTAGAGVAWLHVRLDDRPKYYRHAPYRTAPRR